jgi:hypothetical protein
MSHGIFAEKLALGFGRDGWVSLLTASGLLSDLGPVDNTHVVETEHIESELRIIGVFRRCIAETFIGR